MTGALAPADLEASRRNRRLWGAGISEPCSFSVAVPVGGAVMNRHFASVSFAVCLFLCLSLVPLSAAQNPTSTASALPRLVRFGGVVKELDGNPLTGVVGITFAFYSEQTGGAARWVGVQVSGQAEQPRVLLVSAPYAFKAGDAETIGGLPPSAFVLATPATSGGAVPASDIATTSTSGSAVPLASSDVTTTGGTLYAIPMFSTAT